MPNLSIKEVPEAWAAALRQQALRNHRSLQGELMALLERALHTPQAPVLPAGAGLPPSTRRGSLTLEQLHAEHVQQFAQPIAHGPLAVDLIRADRDAR